MVATSLSDIASYFSVDTTERITDELSAPALDSLVPNYNVAPTDPIPIVIERDEERVLTAARWGFVPFWDKSNKPNAKMINARCETVATTNAFKRAIRHHRCLVPADGFYEWNRTKTGTKQPFYITPATDQLFAFAGLFSRQRDDSGSVVGLSCTIMTSPPSAAMAALHDRMPVTVDRDRWDAWLAPHIDDAAAFEDLYEPEQRDVAIRPVGSAVNKVANNSPTLINPLEPDLATVDGGQQRLGVQQRLGDQQSLFDAEERG